MSIIIYINIIDKYHNLFGDKLYNNINYNVGSNVGFLNLNK